MKNPECKIRRGSVVHGNRYYAALRASQENSHPGGGVRSPDDDAIAFANLARIELAGKSERELSDFVIFPTNYSIAIALGVCLFLSEALKVGQIISDAGSSHDVSVNHLAD